MPHSPPSKQCELCLSQIRKIHQYCFVQSPIRSVSKVSCPSRRDLLRTMLACSMPGISVAEPPQATPTPLLLWNESYLRWVRQQAPPPCLTARGLAILHLALWRAASTSVNPASAIQNAAHEVCSSLFPGADMTGLTAGMARDPRARALARVVLDSRAADGSSTTIHYAPKEEPGQWRRTPLAMRPPELPHWGKVTPFLLKSAGQFRPPPPPDIAGKTFAEDLAEVRDLGGKVSIKRTAAETETAQFWSDFSYTTSPPGHWNDIARQLAARLSLKQSARLLALLNLALADAAIACWECKYHYNFWRPVTVLNRDAAAKWEPLLATPPHPEYVSGHSTFSGAAVAVLQSFFGTDRLTFTATSDTVQGVTRRFNSLKACADEISRSRTLGGIHFPTACREGLVLGRKVGEWTVRVFGK